MLLDVESKHSVAFIDLRIARDALVIAKRLDQSAVERELNVLRVDHRKSLSIGRATGCGTTLCLLTDLLDIWFDKAMSLVSVYIFQIVIVDLHERVFEDLTSRNTLIWLLVEKLL